MAQERTRKKNRGNDDRTATNNEDRPIAEKPITND